MRLKITEKQRNFHENLQLFNFEGIPAYRKLLRIFLKIAFAKINLSNYFSKLILAKIAINYSPKKAFCYANSRKLVLAKLIFFKTRNKIPHENFSS